MNEKQNQRNSEKGCHSSASSDASFAMTQGAGGVNPEQAFCREAVWEEMRHIDALLKIDAKTHVGRDALWQARRDAILIARTELGESTLSNIEQQNNVIRHCKDSILLWFRYFAWTFDPRPQKRFSPLVGAGSEKDYRPVSKQASGMQIRGNENGLEGVNALVHNRQTALGDKEDALNGQVRNRSNRAIGKLPMVLYPYQMETVLRINEAIAHGDDALIEKSRDMGLSWLVCLVFQYRWLFCDDQQFLIGSRNAASADTKGDLSSLMEKCRYNLREQPAFILPQHFDWRKHDVGGRLLNPDNGNAIMSEAATENFARGGRYSAILMDEFAFWGNADAAYASAGQSSYTRIVVSTPNGRHNRFAVERFSGLNPVITVHWRLHPLKDDDWYNAQCRRLLSHEIARELDINYEKSTRDRVFNEFSPQNIQANLKHDPNEKITRVWDFGYHTPAVLFMQVDQYGRLMVLREVIGEQIVLAAFVENVKRIGQEDFGDAVTYQDYCDPAGHQHNDKSEHTSIEVLKNAGINVEHVKCPITESIEKVRHLCVETRNVYVDKASDQDKANPPKGFVAIGNSLYAQSVALVLDDSKCPHLLQAMQGAYRYRDPEREELRQEHPYEDVADCLRYGAWALMTLKGDGVHWNEEQARIRESVWKAKQRMAENIAKRGYRIY